MTIEAVLSATVVRPVYVGFLDILGDPVRGWTGPGVFAPTGTGDPDLDGETFFSAEGAVQITEFRQDQGIGSPVTVTFAAGDMEDELVFQQLVADNLLFMGKKAKFWLFFLSPDESSVLTDFEVMFDGVMTSAETKRTVGSPATISITCDQDTQKAKGPPLRWIDHALFNAGDTFSSYIADLSRGAVSGTAAPSNTPLDRRKRSGGTGPSPYRP